MAFDRASGSVLLELGRFGNAGHAVSAIIVPALTIATFGMWAWLRKSR